MLGRVERRELVRHSCRRCIRIGGKKRAASGKLYRKIAATRRFCMEPLVFFAPRVSGQIHPKGVVHECF